MTGETPAGETIQEAPPPAPADRSQQLQAILGDGPPLDSPWRVVFDTPPSKWVAGMVPERPGRKKGEAHKRQAVTPDAARFVYLRMKPPRTMKRLSAGLMFLGFEGELPATLREWAFLGQWANDAIAYDMGGHTLTELRDRIRKTRLGTLIPAMEGLSAALEIALDADNMEKVIAKATEKGDLPAYMEGVGRILEHMSTIAGENAPQLATPQVHQHIHAHVGAPGTAPALTSGNPESTPVMRVLAGLDDAAEKKRKAGIAKAKANGAANGKTINGEAKEVK